MKKDQKEQVVKWRVTSRKKNRLKGLAKMYAGGNLSAWLEYCTENYNPKFIRKEEHRDRAKSARSR